MNVAIIFLSLVIGGADVGPPTGDNSDLPGIAPPTAQVPLQPELRSALQRQSMRGGSTRGVPAGSVRGNTRAAPQSTAMPSAPTSDSDSEQQYQWQAPTAAPARGAATGMGGGTGGGGMGGSGFYGQSRRPCSPTHPGPGQAKSYNAQQDAQLLQMRLQAAQQATAPSAQQPSKAFSGVQMNTGSSSPYMNLYRTGTNNGTIDNYTTLVRPQFNQQRTNQQFGADINSLENATRVQGFSLNQLNRDTHNLQGVKYQQFFMNYGDFYPNAR
jgi:hypothetical protein